MAAHSQPLVVAASDEEVIRGWQAAMPGSPTPVLTPQADGTRLTWTGAATADAYDTRVRSGSGYTGSPQSNGTFGKASTQGDARWVHGDGTVDAFGFRTLHTDDRSALPRSAYQLGNLQVGRTAGAWSFAAGDVAPNFSRLSSALGVRGALGQVNLGPVALSGFTGRVAESWEALGRPVLRTQPVRTVHGGKLELPLGETLKVHATSQQYAQERLPNDSAAAGAPRAVSRNSTLGLQYAKGDLTLTGEAATSRLDDDVHGDREGHAGVVDGTWRMGTAALRFGAHHIDPGYTSLSQGATPGVEEAYVALDWPVVSWLTLGGDVRTSRNSTLATELMQAVVSRTRSAALNATVNFGSEWPGWSATLQRAVSESTSAGDQRQANEATSAGITYYGPVWNFQLARSRAVVENSSYPAGNSTTEGWTGNVRRNWAAAEAGAWTAAVGLSGRSQVQRMALGLRSEARDVAVQVSADRPGVANLSLAAAIGTLQQATDAAPVRTRSVQADVTVPIAGDAAQLKFYLRYSTRDGADPVLELMERTVGLQLAVRF
ncbi:hypothetical protein FN976_22400 [Caenimonas sedimenti]|uniref:Uncharacterized protein n=1 Tax=Caenimonas sedimenti TaxID=2596921 RepID=A0A562ZKP4_9BURK|nr:hypothetical protein [Caenimonas sedimenti]TWO68744.1 hypothetical protein FN976_22400 [Caenimonas sedimenti]